MPVSSGFVDRQSDLVELQLISRLLQLLPLGEMGALELYCIALYFTKVPPLPKPQSPQALPPKLQDFPNTELALLDKEESGFKLRQANSHESKR